MSSKIFFTEERLLNGNIQLARTILALSLIATVIFTPFSDFFIADYFKQPHNTRLLYRLNFIYALGEKYLLYSQIIIVASLVLVVSGFLNRISSLLHWYITYCFFSSAIIVEGGDQISTIVTLLLIPVIFVDNRKNLWIASSSKLSMPRSFIVNSILFLIKFQLLVLYLNSAVSKFWTDEWLDGSAMYYWLNHNTFGLSPSIGLYANIFLSNHFFVSFITYAVIFIELVFSYSLVLSFKIRKEVFKIAIIFHFMTYILFGLFSFFLSMTGILILSYLPYYYEQERT